MPRPLAAVSQGEVDYGRPNCRVNYQAVILGAKLLQLMQLAVVDERIDVERRAKVGHLRG